MAMALAVTLCACGLLKTRDPESPDTGNASTPPAFTPDAVIENLTTSFSNKNVNDYSKLFADTASTGKLYVFVPTQEASATYASFFAHWTVDAELNYFRKAVASASPAVPPSVTFTGTPITTQYLPDSTLYENDYNVTIGPNSFVGHARFHLMPNKSTGIWVMYRWEDFPLGTNSTAATWSDLKGQFSQ